MVMGVTRSVPAVTSHSVIQLQEYVHVRLALLDRLVMIHVPMVFLGLAVSLGVLVLQKE